MAAIVWRLAKGLAMGREPKVVGTLGAAEDNYTAQRDALKDAVRQGARIGLNSLPLAGKQAAFALERRGDVRIVEQDQELVVEKPGLLGVFVKVLG